MRLVSPMRLATGLLAIASLAVDALPVGAVAPRHRFRRIADSATMPSGAAGPLVMFDELAFDGQRVALRARTADGTPGVYLWDGGALTTVADTTSTVPGGGTFTSFHALDLDAGRIAFIANGTQGSGVYTTLGGLLRRVVDTSTAMPAGGGATFTAFTNAHGVAIDGSTIAFTGRGAGGGGPQEGVYLESAGNLLRIADRNTAIPDAGPPFLFFNEVDVSGGNVAFMGGRGSGGLNGYFSSIGAPPGGVRVVANASTSLGGLVNPLNFFTPTSVRLEGSDHVFAARDAVQNRGIYRESGGVITTVVNSLTIDPVTGTTFSAVGGVYSLSEGAVAFYGASTGPAGIYLGQGEVLANVVRVGASLQGKLVSGLTLFANSLAQGRIAFAATFNDGTAAAYLAEPWNLPQGPDVRTFAPLFNAAAFGGNIQAGGSRIDVLQGDDPPGVADRCAVLEFDLSDLPAGAHIQSARLELDLSALECTPTEGPTLAAYGYQGNGAIDAGDAQQTSLELGQSPMATELGAFEFALDPSAVQQSLGAGSILGIVLRGDAGQRLLGFRTLECWDGNPALLTLTFAAPPSADFDGNGIVDGADRQVWEAHFGEVEADSSSGDADGDYDVDGADLLAWQRMLAPSAGSGGSAMPEPDAVTLIVGGAACAGGWGARRRRQVGKISRDTITEYAPWGSTT